MEEDASMTDVLDSCTFHEKIVFSHRQGPLLNSSSAWFMISFHMKNGLIMPGITCCCVWVCVWIAHEFAGPSYQSANPSLYPPAGSCSLPVGSRLIDWGGFTDTGEDGRVTEGVLFRGTHNLALEAVNKCKSWRQRGNEGEKNREDKDFALTPRP